MMEVVFPVRVCLIYFRSDTYGLSTFVQQRFPSIWERFLGVVSVIRFEFDEKQKAPCELVLVEKRLQVSFKSSVRRRKKREGMVVCV